MNVGHILSSKGSSVLAIDEAATIADAVHILSGRNIGSLVVQSERSKVAGILSERDVVRALDRLGSSALDEPVSSVMTPAPFTCTTMTTIAEAMGMMTARRFRHLPVVEGGNLIGIVSIGDVVKYKIEEAEREAAELREYIAT